MSEQPKLVSLHRSLRMQIRMGHLRRSQRIDPAGDLDSREPEELLEDVEGDGFITFGDDEEIVVE